MAKTIDYLTCMVGVTPYEHEGHNYDALNIIVAYRKGQGFVISWQPVKRTDMGYMTGPMPSSDPLVAGKGFVAKAATRNNANTLYSMRASLMMAEDGIRYYFDQRDFESLKTFMGDRANYGYTDDARRAMETIINNANNQNNETTMATKNQTKNESANGVNNAMLKQFEGLKTKHPDAILLFRCGDFYELYKQDATDASAILGITATKRDGMATAMFPHQDLDKYLPKLIRAGKRVAICDQLEDPNTKKLVKRGGTEEVSQKAQKSQKEDKAVVQPISDHGTLVIGGCGLTPKKEEPIAETIAEEKPVTLKRKVTLKTKQPQEPIAEQPQEVSVSEGLPQVQLSTYTTKKGATAPQIIGFAGEDDPRWVRNKGKKCVSASYRRDLQGNKVYILLFGTKYMDAARAMTDAYNTADTAAWEAAEAQAQATLEQAQADGKAAWEAKKQEWAEKKAAREAKKAATETATTAKTYTEAEVAALMQRVLKNDAQAIAEVNAMLEKAA